MNEVSASDEKLSRYLEESKDSDAPKLSFDDEDGETICEVDPTDMEDLLELTPKEEGKGENAVS